MASHSFISILRNKHSFNLTVFGFSINTTFIVNMHQKVTMTITNMILSTDWSFPLVIKKPLYTIANTLVKLTIRPTLALLVKRPKFVLVMKQLIHPTPSIDIKRPLFALTMRLAQKMGSWLLSIPAVSLTLAPIVAQFHLLLTYDPQVLSDLDNTTLVDMDYSVVP
jgi:hypothetical protein